MPMDTLTISYIMEKLLLVLVLSIQAASRLVVLQMLLLFLHTDLEFLLILSPQHLTEVVE